jgi:hypothetical protein
MTEEGLVFERWELLWTLDVRDIRSVVPCESLYESRFARLMFHDPDDWRYERLLGWGRRTQLLWLLLATGTATADEACG